MCIRVGDDEIESVKGLMSMSLKALVAEALNADIETIEDSSRLTVDLKMDARGRLELETLIAEYFDGLVIDASTTVSYRELLEQVVLHEFHDLNRNINFLAA